MDIDNLRVASACPISWEEMAGDNSVRFCKHCELNVYNFSELTRKEAEDLLAKTEGRLCGRLYRRADGTLLIKDCPVGLRALRKRMSRRAAAVFATVVGICSAVFGQTSQKDAKTSCTPQVKVSRADKVSDSAATAWSGTVRDANGAAIPFAKVVIKNLSTSKTDSTVTRDDGSFTFSGLTKGKYSITIEATGFKKLIVPEVKITDKLDFEMALILELSGESVTVGIIGYSSMIDLPPGSFTISGEPLRMLTH